MSFSRSDMFRKLPITAHGHCILLVATAALLSLLSSHPSLARPAESRPGKLATCHLVNLSHIQHALTCRMLMIIGSPSTNTCIICGLMSSMLSDGVICRRDVFNGSDESIEHYILTMTGQIYESSSEILPCPRSPVAVSRSCPLTFPSFNNACQNFDDMRTVWQGSIAKMS